MSFETCFRVSRVTRVGEMQSSKIAGFRKLADHLDRKTIGRLKLSGAQAGDQLVYYMKMFINMLKNANSTGAGIDVADKEKGLKRMRDELEILCPLYERMKALLNGQANVTRLYHVKQINIVAATAEEEDEDGGSKEGGENKYVRDDRGGWQGAGGFRACFISFAPPDPSYPHPTLLIISRYSPAESNKTQGFTTYDPADLKLLGTFGRDEVNFYKYSEDGMVMGA
ncbi:hypothetical protein BDK51DRAFT_40685 [Blyttiomyces helicus]|uniref:Uncharacterized protein n=1 Tax=Blyttiomyces helicus TaxID=388810 RepID=A0A4P9W4S8_9FUNG|nr:hypothetical protein BDK51DRAFT_40685 [Blyttiomyces helicus]|eukprot:RKO85878.1 hypothetical protein BDK51DRAFT_40685 [Blyttiomyces helicus]